MMVVGIIFSMLIMVLMWIVVIGEIHDMYRWK